MCVPEPVAFFQQRHFERRAFDEEGVRAKDIGRAPGRKIVYLVQDRIVMFVPVEHALSYVFVFPEERPHQAGMPVFGFAVIAFLCAHNEKLPVPVSFGLCERDAPAVPEAAVEA